MERRPPKGVVDEIGGKRQMGQKVSFCQLVFDLDKDVSDSLERWERVVVKIMVVIHTTHLTTRKRGES